MYTFPTYADVQRRLRNLVSCCSSPLRVISLGVSLEGRPLEAYAIGSSASPRLAVTSLIHGREPAGVVIVLSALERLCAGADAIRAFLGSRELIFMPVVNPDGYAAGMQRKNRRPGCVDLSRTGVDLNRNFAFNWKPVPDPCDEEYSGGGPFSEPETKAVKKLLDDWQPLVVMNFHSFGDFLTFPFNSEGHMTPAAESTFHAVAELLAFSRSGPAPKLLGYSTNGESDDWIFGSRGIIAVSPEVGPEAGGFFPPSAMISTIVEENVARINRLAWRVGPDFTLSKVKESVIVTNQGLSEFSGDAWLAVSTCHVSASGLESWTGVAVYADGTLFRPVTFDLRPGQNTTVNVTCTETSNTDMNICVTSRITQCVCTDSGSGLCERLEGWIKLSKSGLAEGSPLESVIGWISLAALYFTVFFSVRKFLHKRKRYAKLTAYDPDFIGREIDSF